MNEKQLRLTASINVPEKMQAEKVTAVPSSMISGVFAKHPGVASSEADYAVLLDADASSYMIFSFSPVSMDNFAQEICI